MKKTFGKKLQSFLLRVSTLQYYIHGWNFYRNPHYQEAIRKSNKENNKTPSRTEIINYLLSKRVGETFYLEIGVRNPADHFNHIKASHKYGVDPGKEFPENPVEFKMTSDEFFAQLPTNMPHTRFDIIFIDGLHLADQVDRDITNALNYIKPDGFILLHDCNPPSYWHAREIFDYPYTPANMEWNGTTWKAFLKWRFNPLVKSCCIDTDWGVGIISKTHFIGESIEPTNLFYEYLDFDRNREHYLNLVSFETFQSMLGMKKRESQ